VVRDRAISKYQLAMQSAFNHLKALQHFSLKLNFMVLKITRSNPDLARYSSSSQPDERGFESDRECVDHS